MIVGIPVPKIVSVKGKSCKITDSNQFAIGLKASLILSSNPISELFWAERFRGFIKISNGT